MNSGQLLELYVKLHTIEQGIKDGGHLPFKISHDEGDYEDVIEGTFTRRRKVPPAGVRLTG